MPFDAEERAQLCDLLDELGPRAPTLLAPWTTADLAAHLVLRERDLVAAPGLVVPGPWGRFAEQRRLGLKQRDYSDLVARIRSGPPPGFFRVGWVRDLANLNEFFVHHEDVRRANGRGPRALATDEDAALWRNVVRGRRLLARRLHGAGLELARRGRDEVVRARNGEPAARLSGDPGELLLYLFGRRDAADVELTGPSVAIAAVRGASFGL